MASTLVRTTGTAAGDFLSEGNPHLGFGPAAIAPAVGLALPWLVTYPPEVAAAIAAQDARLDGETSTA